MLRFSLRLGLVLACAMLVAAAPLVAGNGNLLHGVGAVNSSLGGVSTAMKTDIIGALNTNPALLTRFEGYEIGFSAEVFDDQPIITVDFNNTPGRPDGTFTTEADTELGVLPAIAIGYRPKGKRWAIGGGLLAVAGFRTDWPQDPNNPIFSPQPNGFGAVKTNLAIIKIPFALAYQVSERLSIGGAIDLFQGSLAISPLPPAVPDCTLGDPATGVTRDCFYADADNTVTSYAVSLQLGVHFQVNERWSLGASYTTAQDYDDYEWNSSIALPYLRQGDGSTIVNPDFGRGRTIRYALDGAAIASVGAAYRHSERLQIGVDVRFIEYTSVDGAGGVGGFKPDGSLNEIGWDDIWVGAIGVEYHASERLTLRGGFNYGETPIREAVVFTSLGTPPTFEQHYTFGLGLQLTDAVRLDVGAYYVPENSISGPVLNPNLVPNPTTIAEQTVPGATFTLSEELRSVLFAFNFQF